MNTREKRAIIRLFNAGKLTAQSAAWYAARGYALVVQDGHVTDIVEDVGGAWKDAAHGGSRAVQVV